MHNHVTERSARYHELRRDPFSVSDVERVQLTQTGQQSFGVQRRRTVDGLQERGRALTSIGLSHERPLTARRAALIDGPLERGSAAGRRQLVETDARRAGTLAEHRDSVRIAAKRRDVLLDPAKCQLLISQTEVPCKPIQNINVLPRTTRHLANRTFCVAGPAAFLLPPTLELDRHYLFQDSFVYGKLR